MEQIFGMIAPHIYTVIAAVVSFIVGLSVIKPKLSKAVAVIGEIAELLAEIKKASADGAYTAEEIQAIAKEGEDLIKEFKK